MKKNYLLGIDAGTTSVKGIITDIAGNLKALAGREYQLEVKGDYCELDPEVYWYNTKQVISELLEVSKVPASSIIALSFASQAETLIPLNKNGKPLRKAIVWLDNRSVKEAKQIENDFGNKLILEKTGQPEIMPLWPANRILWLRNNEKEIFTKTHKYLLVEDYLIYRFTGKYCTEHSVSSSTLYLDIIKKQWWDEMLEYLKITPDVLPELNTSGTSISKISEKASSETGLSAETLIVAGGYDHAAGAIGAGNIDIGTISETTGASMAMVVTLNEPLLDKELNLPCHCHAIPGKYFLLPYGQTAGMVMKWFKDQFCREEKLIADRKSVDVYDIITNLAEKVKPGSGGLIMLPHLMGTGSPEFDSNVKGVFAGITLDMDKGHFIRAIMESVACMVYRNLETLARKGIRVNKIKVLGGASRSDLWNQIKADMTGIPIITSQISENAALGAAILAGIGSSLFANIPEGCSSMIRIKSTYLPNEENKATYSRLATRYKSLYEHLQNYW